MKRYVVLDVLRVIAISLLLTAHVGQALGHPIGGLFGLKNFYYISLGGLAVTIFLILSGIVLELQYGGDQIEYSTFILKRALRIYPIYYLSVLLGIGLYFLKKHLDGFTVYSTIQRLNISDLLFSLTGGYSFAGKWGGPFVATSWFIGLIMAMYLIYPSISQALKRRPIFILCATCIISVITRIVFGNSSLLPNRPLDWFPLCRIFEFTFGIFIANQIPKYFFHAFDNMNIYVEKSINFISLLSFPLFLIHYPLCFVIHFFTTRGVAKSLSIISFLFISCLLSFIAMKIDDIVPRQQLIRGFERWSKKAEPIMGHITA